MALHCCPLLCVLQVQAANILDIPVVVTEQYPKGEWMLLFAHVQLCMNAGKWSW